MKSREELYNEANNALNKLNFDGRFMTILDSIVKRLYSTMGDAESLLLDIITYIGCYTPASAKDGARAAAVLFLRYVKAAFDDMLDRLIKTADDPDSVIHTEGKWVYEINKRAEELANTGIDKTNAFKQAITELMPDKEKRDRLMPQINEINLYFAQEDDTLPWVK